MCGFQPDRYDAGPAVVAAERELVLVGAEYQFAHAPVPLSARGRGTRGLRRRRFQADGLAQFTVRRRREVRVEQQPRDPPAQFGLIPQSGSEFRCGPASGTIRGSRRTCACGARKPVTHTGAACSWVTRSPTRGAPDRPASAGGSALVAGAWPSSRRVRPLLLGPFSRGELRWHLEAYAEPDPEGLLLVGEEGAGSCSRTRRDRPEGVRGSCGRAGRRHRCSGRSTIWHGSGTRRAFRETAKRPRSMTWAFAACWSG